MAELTTEQFKAAKERGDARLRGPRAEMVHYDSERDRVIVKLTTGVEVGFAPRDAEGLRNASVDDLNLVEVEAFGLGIHFPTIDADIYVPALLKGLFGSRRWMAARLRAASGVASSAAKTAASRENARRGGRPRKAAAVSED